MHRFDLYVPTTLDEAHARLAEHDSACILAGGTALALLIKEKLVRPDALVSLTRVMGLDGAEKGSLETRLILSRPSRTLPA